MYEFSFHRATSLDEALKRAAAGDEAKFLAGGMTLLPTMKHRLAAPTDIIDLSGIADLKGISVDGNTVSIGAMVTHAEVAASTDVAKAIPALSDLAGHIGDRQVRNRGTLGGSVANNDPAADYPGAVVGLNATVHTDRRQIAADDFFTGIFETALEEDELVTRVAFPLPEKAAYMKFPNPASRYAMAGVFVAKFPNGCRVAVTGAGPCVFRVPEMEQALAGGFESSRLEGISVPAAGLSSDIHASAEYRAHLIGVMARRAVDKAAG
ncbi:MAG: xanthine dehydrogenase family protein subunit M [Acetobacterales bacterium]